MGYCDGLCPYLDSKKHKCRQTGEKLGYIKSWWGVTYEHHGFADCDKSEVQKMNEKYENNDQKCECWKCELKETCPYKDKYQRLPRTNPGALGLCKKLKR